MIIIIGKINRIIPLILVAAMFVTVLPGNALAQTPDNSLSLERALQIAYKSNPDLKKAELDVEQAQINRDDAMDYVTFIPTGGLLSPSYQQVYNSYQKAEIALTGAKRSQKVAKDKVTVDVIGAYVDAVKNYNNLRLAELTLDNLMQQLNIIQINKLVGNSSDFEVSSFLNQVEQAQNTVKSAKAQYDSSISALGTIMGKSQGWTPVLTTKAVSEKYIREPLNVELSQGLSQSVSVWQSQQLLDIQKTQESWVIPNYSNDQRNLDMSTAENTLEQAKTKTAGAIEQLYYGIDATQEQIAAAKAAYQQSQREMEIVQLQYDLGLIPRYSLQGSNSLASAALAEQKAQINLENLKASLASYKAQFAYLTGQTVYDAADWTPEPETVATAK